MPKLEPDKQLAVARAVRALHGVADDLAGLRGLHGGAGGAAAGQRVADGDGAVFERVLDGDAADHGDDGLIVGDKVGVVAG